MVDAAEQVLTEPRRVMSQAAAPVSYDDRQPQCDITRRSSVVVRGRRSGGRGRIVGGRRRGCPGGRTSGGRRCRGGAVGGVGGVGLAAEVGGVGVVGEEGVEGGEATDVGAFE
jgi:hypothetical protein